MMGMTENDIGERRKRLIVVEGKIVFLLHNANVHNTTTTPNQFIKQDLEN
jgi:hypothetical protein